MKFIEIKEGTCVRKDEIIAIESVSPTTSRIVLQSTTYDSNFSYEAIKQLLEMPDIEETLSNQLKSPSNTGIGPTQFWRG